MSKRRPSRTARKAPSRASARAHGLAPSLFPTQHGLDELYSRLRAPCGVTGFFVGRKSTRGKWRRRLAIVCCVRNKISKKDLKNLPPDARIPSSLPWKRTRTAETVLPTDVVEIRDAYFQQTAPLVGTGDVLAAAGEDAASGHATIGIALQHPEFGPVVTTAGHAFIRNGEGSLRFDAGAAGLRIFNAGQGVGASVFNVRPLKAVISAIVDYALLVPTDPGITPRNLFEDTFNLTEPQFARPEDIGKRLFALTRRGRMPTTLLGVAGALEIGGVSMQGLLLTDRVTEGGDSGCALVDNKFRVWGLLVGAATVSITSSTGGQRLVLCSIFAPANFVMAMERAELIS